MRPNIGLAAAGQAATALTYYVAWNCIWQNVMWLVSKQYCWLRCIFYCRLMSHLTGVNIQSSVGMFFFYDDRCRCTIWWLTLFPLLVLHQICCFV